MGARKRRADQASGDSPFVPGQGQVPPYLAGRETEQALIRNLCSKLEHGRAPGTDLLLYGPRGNGKTALLEWALREARARGVGTVDFSSKQVESPQSLARRLSWLPSWLPLPSEVSAFGVGIKQGEAAVGRISAGLARRARRRGLVVAIDEAHTLALDTGQRLLHAVQRLRRKQAPVLLLLAGTPDLPRHLGRMEASFWGRSKRLSLGLLRPDAAADAVRIPMEAEGRSIRAEALAQVVAESHGYPFFLQVWGELVWEEMPDAGRPASLDEVDRARPRFEDTRNTYYRDRYVELELARLDGVAAELALSFADADKRTGREVNKTIRLALASEGRDSGKESVLTARDQLYDLGYIWSEGGESRLYFQPGIPSLMRFVARCRDMDVGVDRS